MYKILLVEDSKIIQRVHSLLLQALGYTVELVATGKKAIMAVKNCNYDLVLLDIGLPDISGLNVLKHIRLKLKSHVPVVVLTAQGNEIKRECINAGANDFLIKPLSRQKTCRVMAQLVEKLKSSVPV